MYNINLFYIDYYQELYEKSKKASEDLINDLELDLYHNTTNHSDESKVLYFYNNQSNLSIKYSPSMTEVFLSTEIRHILNII